MSKDKNTSGVDTETVRSHLRKHMYKYLLSIVALFTVFTRIQGYEALRSGGRWLFSGNDGWYHFRSTMSSVENYPSTIDFDAKTGYPFGSEPGAFGTVYDLFHATISMIIGLGDPGPSIVSGVLVFSPPVLSALTVVAVYFLAKEISNSRVAGLLSAVILALIPGTFYRRGSVGFSQHHIAETLLLISLVYFTVKAVRKAERDVVILEVIQSDGLSEVSEWGKYVVLASMSAVLYFLVWPPAIMYFGIIGAIGSVYALINYSGPTVRSSMLTLTLISFGMILSVLFSVPRLDASIGNPSLIHLGVTSIVFVFSASSWFVLRKIDRQEWDVRHLLGMQFGLGIAFLAVGLIVDASIINQATEQILRIFGYPFGLGNAGPVSTIAEESSTTILDLSFTQYGAMLIVSLISTIGILGSVIRRNADNLGFADLALILGLFLFTVAIGVRTIRFNYYLAPLVAVVAAYGIVHIIRFVEIPDSLDSVKLYHIIAVLILATLFIPVLVVPVEGGSTVYEPAVSENSVVNYNEWEDPLEWLSNNSPSDGIGRYTQYDSSFEYGDESYGIMSWWDYGHWITVTGNRTPVANPFQQNAQNASEYLLAQSPDEAESVIEEMDTSADVDYIAIDSQMASPRSKYSAMEVWNPEFDAGDSFEPYIRVGQRGSQLLQYQKNQVYYETMIGRLFVGHGSSMDASKTTIDYNSRQGFRTVEPATNPITVHNSTEDARNATENNTEISRGGIFGSPPERVDALEQYRLVKAGERPTTETQYTVASILGLNQLSSEINLRDSTIDELRESGAISSVPKTVKIFQNVDGADIHSQNLTEGETYTLQVDVQSPNEIAVSNGYNFTYKQYVTADENGEFTATVPYSNTGYESVEFAPEVRGVSQYRLVDSDGNIVDEFDVSETDVQNDTDPITTSP